LDTGAGYIHGAVIVFPVKTAKGVVTLTVSLGHLLWLDAKMKFGTDEVRREASAEMSKINQAIANHVSESAGYLVKGAQEPGAIADAIVELGPTRSASIIGESSAEGALVAEGGVKLLERIIRRRTVITPWGTREVATGKWTKGGRGGLDPVDDFAAQAESAGYEVLGKEVTVRTPFGKRKLDVVLRDPRTGEVGAVEVKSTLDEFSKFNKQQFSADRWINRFGAEAVGENAGAAGVTRIESTVKVLWEAPE
jgi:hypothetical protein